MSRLNPATEVVHLGRPPAGPGQPVNPAVVLSSTFHQGGDPSYGRDGNPTWSALEEVLGHLEGGECLIFASGLAAISAVVETLAVPGRVVVAGDAYSGTRRFLSDVAGRGRLRFRVADVTDTEATLAVCAEMVETPGRPSGAEGGFGAGGLLWLESPTNPLLAIADIAALCAGAHELGMDVAVDNTFASPLLQQPLALGADVVVHSATKIISGHSDVILGATVTDRPDLARALAERRSLHGAVAGPWEAWLALRGLRTLALRVERCGTTAALVAQRLAGHPRVAAVRYPGLAGHPGHDLAAAQMSGFGSLVSFEVKGGADAADAVTSRLRLLTVATSLGGVETLIERRARWAGEAAVPPSLLRLSLGIEDPEDIWADLEQALG